MDGRLVVGDLRVQEIFRGNGRVSYTVVDTDCTLVAEADGVRSTATWTRRLSADRGLDCAGWLSTAQIR